MLVAYNVLLPCPTTDHLEVKLTKIKDNVSGEPISLHSLIHIGQISNHSRQCLGLMSTILKECISEYIEHKISKNLIW